MLGLYAGGLGAEDAVSLLVKNMYEMPNNTNAIRIPHTMFIPMDDLGVRTVGLEPLEPDPPSPAASSSQSPITSNNT